ncbi:MAG: fimbrillin family protein [Alistipes sp.]|nr:fimbrillin family protein [Alistipes sp.]
MLRKSLFVIAFCGLLASCSTRQELDPRNEGVIRLGVGKIVTRAEVGSVTALGDNIGIYGVQLPEKPADLTDLSGIGWGNALSMNNVRSTGVAASGAISWDGIYYYPLDPAHYIKFCAYHPYAADGTNFSVDAPADGQAPVLRFALDGTDDILYAAPVIGSRSEVPAALTFRHALTQLMFKIKDVHGELRRNKTKVLNIIFQDVNTVSSMDIETGIFGEWSAPDNLKVPGIEGEEFAFEEEGPDFVAPGDAIMLEPGLASFKITLETSDGTFSDVTIRPSGEPVFAAGHSYEITITFNEQQAEISAAATVVDWKFGGTTNIIIQ